MGGWTTPRTSWGKSDVPYASMGLKVGDVIEKVKQAPDVLTAILWVIVGEKYWKEDAKLQEILRCQQSALAPLAVGIALETAWSLMGDGGVRVTSKTVCGHHYMLSELKRWARELDADMHTKDIDLSEKRYSSYATKVKSILDNHRNMNCLIKRCLNTLSVLTYSIPVIRHSITLRYPSVIQRKILEFDATLIETDCEYRHLLGPTFQFMLDFISLVTPPKEIETNEDQACAPASW